MNHLTLISPYQVFQPKTAVDQDPIVSTDPSPTSTNTQDSGRRYPLHHRQPPDHYS